MSARYQYLPWVRTGAAQAYATPDSQAPVLAPTGDGSLSVVPVTLKLNDRTPVDVPLRLYGPGDVLGIDSRAVLRTDPLPRTADFESNYLACVEFDAPDFPWLFTPARAGADGRLRPWLVLVVVRQSEDVALQATRPDLPPALDAPVRELPDLAESWAWAHAQAIQLDPAEPVASILASQPERNLSRLVCPRRLEPNTRYLACVVPAFEAGRKAGLGEEVTSADEERLGPAWDAGRARVRLPAYHHWQFATGSGGDFESLARRLQPRAAASGLGRRPLRVGAQPFGLPDGGTLQLEGALVATAPAPRPEPSDAFRLALRDLLDLSAREPVVTPPVYGRWQAATAAVPAAGEPPRWLGELNLQPSERAAAGMGAGVVQRAQEQLVAAAWEQLGDAPAVTDLERRLELAVAVLGSVVRRRLEPMETSRLVQFLGPAHARLRTSPATLRATLAQQGLPPSFSSAPLRRVLRPAGSPARRRLGRGALPLQRLATRLGTVVPPVGPPPTAPGLVTGPELVEQVNKVPRTAIPAHVRYRNAASAVQAYFAGFAGRRSIESRPQFTFTAAFRTALLAGVDPQGTAPARFRTRVSAAAGAGPPAVAPGGALLFAPAFPQPAYELLRDLSPELLLPGVGEIELDTVTLLASNPRFIEAYMVGLNHELAAELLWREFPSDMRATYFNSFWDTRGTPGPIAQLPPIHTWDTAAPLGASFGGGAAQLVLLIRGELLYRYPDALIYAVRARTLAELGTEEKLPLFRGRIDPDITFLGFDLTEAAARGEGSDPGWFFVVQEQPTAPRFGLDESRVGVLETWNDLAWSDVATEPGEHLAPSASAPAVARPGGLAWGFNAAHMAGVLRQRPVRVALHARRLLPAAPPPPGGSAPTGPTPPAPQPGPRPPRPPSRPVPTPPTPR